MTIPSLKGSPRPALGHLITREGGRDSSGGRKILQNSHLPWDEGAEIQAGTDGAHVLHVFPLVAPLPGPIGCPLLGAPPASASLPTSLPLPLADPVPASASESCPASHLPALRKPYLSPLQPPQA